MIEVDALNPNTDLDDLRELLKAYPQSYEEMQLLWECMLDYETDVMVLAERLMAIDEGNDTPEGVAEALTEWRAFAQSVEFDYHIENLTRYVLDLGDVPLDVATRSQGYLEAQGYSHTFSIELPE
jgi:hypothetical protein